MERSGLDELNLRRVRRKFTQRWNSAPYTQKRALTDEGICARFRFVTDILQEVWSIETWADWLVYLEHNEQDLAEMRQGEYPISPYIVRLFSALLGIRTDFLMIGAWPCSEVRQHNIDAYPATGTRA